MKIEKLNLKWNGTLTPIRKVDKLVVHHPAHKKWTAYDIHNYHKNTLKWNGAGYNYFVDKDGRVQELRGKNQGAHVKGHNDHTLGISFQGNFDQEEMTEKQIYAGGWLLSELVKDYSLSINDIIGHRDLAPTSCPGRNFQMEKVKQVANSFLAPKSKDDIEGHWAEESIRKVIAEGKMNGYKDGTFRPDKPLTRAELAHLLANGAFK